MEGAGRGNLFYATDDILPPHNPPCENSIYAPAARRTMPITALFLLLMPWKGKQWVFSQLQFFSVQKFLGSIFSQAKYLHPLFMQFSLTRLIVSPSRLFSFFPRLPSPSPPSILHNIYPWYKYIDIKVSPTFKLEQLLATTAHSLSICHFDNKAYHNTFDHVAVEPWGGLERSLLP